MANILTQIVADKRIELTQLQQQLPLASFINKVTPSNKNFYAAVSRKQVNGIGKGNAKFILECKKASPSKGLIRADFNIVEIATIYQKYAAAISVLTDAKYFQGNYQYLKMVTDNVTCPVLNKDFFISSYQVYLARYYGADAILLMLSVLDDQQYRELADLADSLNLGVLTEISNEQERDRAIDLGAKLIGINNRNLRDLSTDLSQTLNLAPTIPDDRIVIAESGIYSNSHVRELAPAVDGFLVGSSLMAEPNLDLACRKLIYGNHKVCGLRTPTDATTVAQAGGRFGGLIFAEQSVRCVTHQQAQKIVNNVAELDYVGVFVNHQIEQVADLANKLSLFAIQLHGNETSDYRNQLRSLIKPTCQIWQALPIDTELPELLADVEHVVLDGKAAGSGQSFDWQLLETSEQDLSRCILAGGINSNNVLEALTVIQQQELFCLDINSGVEQALGEKSATKIHKIFNQIRQY